MEAALKSETAGPTLKPRAISSTTGASGTTMSSRFHTQNCPRHSIPSPGRQAGAEVPHTSGSLNVCVKIQEKSVPVQRG